MNFQRKTLVGMIAAACVVQLSHTADAALVWHSALDGDAAAIVGMDGVPTGAPAPTTDINGNVGGAVDFSGGNSFFEIDASPEITSLTAGTISAWINWNNSGGEQGAVAVGETGGGATNYFSFMRNNANSIRVDLDDGGARRDAVQGGLSPNTWYHIATTFTDGGTLRLYIDGVEEDIQSLAGDGTYTGLATWLIGTERTGSRFLDGSLDDVRIFDNELSAAEVQSLFAAGPLFNVPEPTSIAIWSLIGLGLVGLGYGRYRRAKR